MAHVSTAQIRNIALLGHAGCGKTTLTEALLAASGEISQAGSVEKGNTVTDFDEAEVQLKHSVDCGLCSFDHGGVHVNLIDLPGYPDFYNRSIAVLPAIETAAVVINGQTGIELIAQRVMNAAAKRQLCRLIIINKIDIAAPELGNLLNEIQSLFGKQCLPLNLPASNGSEVIDCYFNPTQRKTDFLSVSEAHEALIDQVVEVDEKLMEMYLEQEESLTAEQLHNPFEQALREGHLVPVCFVSARTGAGIDQLLRIFEALMPSPLEGNPPLFLKGRENKPVKISQQPDDHIIAHIFKVIINPFYGRLGILRIFQGTIRNDSQLYIGDGRKPYKIGHLLKLQGKKQMPIPFGGPGDICAVAKIDEVYYDAVLHDHHDEDLFHLKQMSFLPPMYGLAIKSTRLGNEQKLSETLYKMAEEDPALLIEHRLSTDETILRGSSELHLRTVLDKMKSQFQLEVETRLPSIAYAETITRAAEGHYRHKKQSGGSGQFGEVYLRVEPLARGEGIEFVNKIKGGTIPSQYLPAVEKGVFQAIDSGSYAGYPLQDIRVTVFDGKHHAVDSKEIAFVLAGKKAFFDAVEKANPIVLEPVVDMIVNAPGENAGDISGDISSMRGMIVDTKTRNNNLMEFKCQVPLSEVIDYQTRLNSITGGSGTFTMELACYQPVPESVNNELHRRFQKATD